MDFDLDSIENLDQAMQLLQKAQSELQKTEGENARLKATKDGLMKDLRKRKSVESFLKVAGIELKPDASEDEIAERIAALRAPVGDDEGDAGSAPLNGQQQASAGQQQAPAGQQQQPPADPPPTSGQQQQQTPSDAMTAAVEARLAALQSQNEALAKTVQQMTKERDEERSERRRAILEQKVLDELGRMECRRPSHLLKLERDNFELLEDGETIMYKRNDEFVPLRDALGELKESDEYSDYFRGSGATGSGLPPSRGTIHSTASNPFVTGNATEAAKLFRDSPEKARQLLNQARASGKVNQTMSQAFADH